MEHGESGFPHSHSGRLGRSGTGRNNSDSRSMTRGGTQIRPCGLRRAQRVQCRIANPVSSGSGATVPLWVKECGVTVWDPRDPLCKRSRFRVWVQSFFAEFGTYAGIKTGWTRCKEEQRWLRNFISCSSPRNVENSKPSTGPRVPSASLRTGRAVKTVGGAEFPSTNTVSKSSRWRAQHGKEISSSVRVRVARCRSEWDGPG